MPLAVTGVIAALALSACSGRNAGGLLATEGPTVEESGSAGTENDDAVDPAAEELLEQADAALRAADAYTVHVTTDSPDLAVTMFLAYSRDEQCTVTAETIHGETEVRRDGDDLWIRYSAGTLTSMGEVGEEMAGVLGDRFIHAFVDDSRMSDIAAVCDREQRVENELWPHQDRPGAETTRLTIEEADDLDGTPVVAVQREDVAEVPSDLTSITSTTLVAVEGEPYPLVVTMEVADTTSTEGTLILEFGDFDADVPFERPAPDSVLENDELEELFGELRLPPIV